MEDKSKKNNVVFGVVGILILGLVGYGVWYMNKKTSDELSGNNPISNTVENPVDKNSIYRDGMYGQVMTYIAPGGPESFGITVTLQNGIITDINVEARAQNEDSKKYQGRFVANIKSLVVGKKIDEVLVDKVSGASLTSQSFNDALDKIKVSAQA